MSLLSGVSIHAWVQENQIKTETGAPLDFRKHMFLFDPYRDTSAKIVANKAAQIGWTTLSLLKSAWVAKHRKLDIIYSMPSSADAKVLVGGKLNRIIAQNPVLQGYTADKDSVEQKNFGDNMIYYRGSWTEREALSVSADLIVNDEYDRSNINILEQYESRLQHSKFQWQWIFSNPSVPGIGVDKFFQLSDQKHWFIHCPSCKKEQYLDWPDSIDVELKQFVCKLCHAILSDDDRRRGRWVQKFKGREWSGYWVPLLLAPWMPASKIIEYHNGKTEEYFHNFVLGKPYAGSGNKVTEDVIFRNLTDKINDQSGRIVIGVDTGIDIRYVIGNEQGLFYYGQCKDYDELDKYLKRWENAVMVIDQGGDIIGSRKLREKYPGRVFLCHYSVDRKTMQLIRWGENDEYGNVIVDRNRVIQLVIDELADKRLPLQGSRSDWHDYWLHWSHIYRVAEEDALGVMRYKWMRSDRDDWVHATCYFRVGMDRFAGGMADILGTDPVLQFPEAPEIQPNQTIKVKHNFVYEREYED